MSLLKLLKKLEWSGIIQEDFGHGDYSPVPCCPICGALNYKESFYAHMNEGHKTDCKLAKQIGIEQSGYGR